MRREKPFISSFHTMTPNIDSPRALLQIRLTSTPRSTRLSFSRELQELRHQSELASPLPTDLNSTPQHASPPISLSDSFVFSLQPLSPPSSAPQPKSTLQESSLHCGDLKAPRADPHSRLHTPYPLTLSPTETTKCMHSGGRCMQTEVPPMSRESVDYFRAKFSYTSMAPMQYLARLHPSQEIASTSIHTTHPTWASSKTMNHAAPPRPDRTTLFLRYGSTASK